MALGTNDLKGNWRRWRRIYRRDLGYTMNSPVDTVPLSVLITSFVVQLCYGCAFESSQIRWCTPVAGVGIRSMFRITWVTWDKVYY